MTTAIAKGKARHGGRNIFVKESLETSSSTPMKDRKFPTPWKSEVSGSDLWNRTKGSMSCFVRASCGVLYIIRSRRTQRKRESITQLCHPIQKRKKASSPEIFFSLFRIDAQVCVQKFVHQVGDSTADLF